MDHAMHIAAMRGLTGAVALLLKHGAVLDATNLCGDTALGLAALFGHLKCIKLLLRAGTLFGWALHTLLTDSFLLATHLLLLRGAFASSVCPAGAKVDGAGGPSPLLHASTSGSLECMKVIRQTHALKCRPGAGDASVPVHLPFLYIHHNTSSSPDDN